MFICRINIFINLISDIKLKCIFYATSGYFLVLGIQKKLTAKKSITAVERWDEIENVCLKNYFWINLNLIFLISMF